MSTDKRTPTGRRNTDWLPLQNIKPGEDLHTKTAAKMFGVPEDQVTYEQRKAAKIRNFEILYGRNVKTFSEVLNHSTNFTIQSQFAEQMLNEVVVKRKRGSDWFTADKVRDGEILRSVINRASFKVADYDTVLAKLGALGLGILSYDENDESPEG